MGQALREGLGSLTQEHPSMQVPVRSPILHPDLTDPLTPQYPRACAVCGAIFVGAEHSTHCARCLGDLRAGRKGAPPQHQLPGVQDALLALRVHMNRGLLQALEAVRDELVAEGKCSPATTLRRQQAERALQQLHVVEAYHGINHMEGS